jgi:hypothetical protein
MQDHENTAIDCVYGGCPIELGVRGHTAARIIGIQNERKREEDPQKQKLVTLFLNSRSPLL